MTANGFSPAEVRKTRAMAKAVITHHFGSKPKRVLHRAGGLTNFVFQVEHGEGDFIVRISLAPAKLNDYLKEQWAMLKARDAGVPVAEILEVGNEVVSAPYMVARLMKGREATHHPDRLAILKDMGRITALIHRVSTTSFGQTFDWSRNQLSRNHTWKAFLHGELKIEERLEFLRLHRMLSGPQLKALRAILARMEACNSKPVLQHGDMRLKNVLVHEDGKIIAIIDWECCTSSIAPWWDLSIALHDLSIDAKQVFLEGYGLSEKQTREMAPAIKALNLIHYVPYIAGLLAAKDKERIERYRTRFSGALDLFSL